MNLSLFQKECKEMLSSAAFWVVLVAFGTASALMHWWFDGTFHLLHAGFADLTPYFDLSPWLLAVFVSALGMRSLAEEKRTGTLHLLFGLPQSTLSLVINKLAVIWLISLLMLLPAFFYLPALYNLSVNPHDFDYSSVLTAYFGLCLLALVFSSFSLLASSLTHNQLLAFFVALGLNLGFYAGGLQLAELLSNGFLRNFFTEISLQTFSATFTKGVIDTRNLFYLLALTSGAVFLTVMRLSANKMERKTLGKKYAYFIVLWSVLLIITQQLYNRFDLTQDKKFTLSQATLTLLKKIDKPVAIDVFLSGNLPGEYRKLQRDISDLLDEMKAANGLINFQFIDPLEDEDVADEVVQQLVNFGLQPLRVSRQKKGQISEQLVFPWAVASIDNETVVNIPLLTEKNHPDPVVKMAQSAQELEYHFYVKISLLFRKDFKKLAVIKGNGEAPDRLLADGLASLRDFYDLAPFTLDSVSSNPIETLRQINYFNVVWIAGPTEAFSEEEKLVLDQYLLNGGKMLLNADKALMSSDSLYNSGSTFALPNDLNLDDFLFKYGLRINQQLVLDKYTSPLMLVSGSGSNQQYNVLPWLYAPMLLPSEEIILNRGVENVRMEFASPIDTLPNAINKTIILQTSPLSGLTGLPAIINLNETLNAFEDFEGSGKKLNVGVLLEGNFTSAYKNRVIPFELPNYKARGKSAKLIVLGDSQLFNSQIEKGALLPLGFDKWTRNRYGNKDLLLNIFNYLTDDYSLISLRSKKLTISYLDLKKLDEESLSCQWWALLMPLLVLSPVFLLLAQWRKRRIY